jgi:hypothetical protein
MIRPGEDWGEAATGPPDLEVTGSDADLAAAVTARPGALVRYRPVGPSDIAQAVGLTEGSSGEWAVPMDALRVDSGTLAVNMVVVGVPPDRARRFTQARIPFEVAVDGAPWWSGKALGAVIATGEFLRGHDVVPRGHPGDGRAEIQVYAERGSERTAVRRRLASGTHVPHPRIRQRTGRSFVVGCAHPWTIEIDGRPDRETTKVHVEVVPNAYRLLV